MPLIPKRVLGLFGGWTLVWASIYLSEAIASPVESGAASRIEVLNLIAEVEASNSRSVRLETSHDLAMLVHKTLQQGHISAIDESMIRRLGDLMAVPDDRYWVALAIGQLGSRASSLAPKLNAALEDDRLRREEQLKKEGIIFYHADDPKVGICLALEKIGADVPKSCSDTKN